MPAPDVGRHSSSRKRGDKAPNSTRMLTWAECPITGCTRSLVGHETTSVSEARKVLRDHLGNKHEIKAGDDLDRHVNMAKMYRAPQGDSERKQEVHNDSTSGAACGIRSPIQRPGSAKSGDLKVGGSPRDSKRSRCGDSPSTDVQEPSEAKRSVEHHRLGNVSQASTNSDSCFGDLKRKLPHGLQSEWLKGAEVVSEASTQLTACAFMLRQSANKFEEQALMLKRVLEELRVRAQFDVR